MGKIVYFDEGGGPEVLKVGQRDELDPQDHEVLLKHTAIGVNFGDIELRRGLNPALNTQTICGTEAVGIIQKLGDKVTGFKIGQKVAYATSYTGAYSELRCIDEKHLVSVPDHIDDKIVAASLLKGMTAHYLARRVFIVQPGTAVLIHSAAGGVGQLLSAYCKHLGALVIGVIGRDEKKEIAMNNCHYVVNYNTESWEQEVLSFTKNIGVNAVYDGIGQKTFNKSLECLMTAGIMISYGQSSGTIPPLNLEILQKKSLFLTCPTVFDYKANRMELVLSMDEVFNLIEAQVLNVNISKTFPLAQAQEAHKLLESGLSTGSIILIP